MLEASGGCALYMLDNGCFVCDFSGINLSLTRRGMSYRNLMIALEMADGAHYTPEVT